MLPVPNGPSMLHLMIGWRCNLACVQCYERHRIAAGSTPRTELTAADVAAILRMYQGTLRSVNVSGHGEPQMHPEYDAIVEAIKTIQPAGGWDFVNTNVNGMFLHAHSGLLDLPGMFTVSFDSYDKTTFEGLRRGSIFDLIVTNLRAARRRQNHPRRQLGINMTVICRNVADIYGTLAFAANEGLDYASVSRAVHLEQSDAKDLGVEADDPRAIEQLARARRDFPQLNIAVHYFKGATSTRGCGGRDVCRMPWSEMLVFNDGGIRPCCFSLETNLGPWSTVHWTGAEYTALRQALEAGQLAEYPACAHCPIADGF